MKNRKTEPIASFPAELYDAYSAIMSLAREYVCFAVVVLLFPPSSYIQFLNKHSINTHMEPPEIVFVGKKGSGKTALIDALLGHKLGDVGNGVESFSYALF